MEPWKVVPGTTPRTYVRLEDPDPGESSAVEIIDARPGYLEPLIVVEGAVPLSVVNRAVMLLAGSPRHPLRPPGVAALVQSKDA